MANVRKHRDIKLVINDIKRNKLVNLNKPTYLGLAILSLSIIKMYEYWYDEMKTKYGDRIRLCYIDTGSFIMHIKTENFYKDIADDVAKQYDTSNYTVERPLPMGKNQKVIGMMNDELGGKIMKEFIRLRPKCYVYLMDDGNVDKKARGTKTCVIKRCIMFNDYIECAEQKNEIIKN